MISGVIVGVVMAGGTMTAQAATTTTPVTDDDDALEVSADPDEAFIEVFGPGQPGVRLAIGADGRFYRPAADGTHGYAPPPLPEPLDLEVSQIDDEGMAMLLAEVERAGLDHALDLSAGLVTDQGTLTITVTTADGVVTNTADSPYVDRSNPDRVAVEAFTALLVGLDTNPDYADHIGPATPYEPSYLVTEPAPGVCGRLDAATSTSDDPHQVWYPAYPWSCPTMAMPPVDSPPADPRESGGPWVRIEGPYPYNGAVGTDGTLYFTPLVVDGTQLETMTLSPAAVQRLTEAIDQLQRNAPDDLGSGDPSVRITIGDGTRSVVYEVPGAFSTAGPTAYSAEVEAFVEFVLGGAGDDGLTGEPYVPEHWVATVSPGVVSESPPVWPGRVPGDGQCVTFPADAPVNATMFVDETDSFVIELRPAYPWDCPVDR